MPRPEIEHEDEDDMQEVDPFELVLGCLQTEDGESIADVMKGVSKSLDTLNKLMVKLVAAKTQLKNTEAN
jgi:hypothetical protein